MHRIFPAIFLALGGVAFAQNVSLPVSATGSPVVRATGGSEMIRLQFPNTDVKEVLGFYGRLTKKRPVFDNQVQGPVNIVVAGEVPLEEAVRIIEINMLLNGFTLVPVENSNIVKVIGGGKNARAAAIPIISDELLLPEGEQVVTFLAKLKFADPMELQQLLTAYIAPAPGNFTNVTALPKSQAILITENTATIRGVLRVLHEIDVPPAEVVSEFIPLERADASDVLEKLTAIFEKQPNQSTSATMRMPQRAPAGPAKGAAPDPGPNTGTIPPETLEMRGGGLSEDSIIVGKIKLTADIRTNRIHVVTRPVNMPFVRKLITEFDSTAKFGEPVSRPLKYVSVGDVLDVVVKAITEPGMKQDGGADSSSTVPVQNGSANRAGGAGFGNNNGNFNGGTNSGSSSEFNVSEGLATEEVDTKPDARVVGTTKIIADKNANAIIVIGSADVRAKVFRLLDYLDQRIPQVMLHTVIGELNLDAKDEFGVDYIIRNSGLGLSPIVLNSDTSTGITTPAGRSAPGLVDLSGGSPALDLNNLLNQKTVRAVAGAGASGLTGFVTAGNSLTAVITALESSSRFRVVSRPSVFTRNNKKAIIASGQEIAVPTNIQSALNTNTGSDGLVTNSQVQFKRVALQLEVVPLINSDREVSLDILQKVDEVSGTTRIDNNDIPTIATRYVKTSVTVPNEGTLVLGGLIKQSQNRSRSGIPFLSNIPVLGSLFSTTLKEKIRTELVILIRPVVSWAPPESLHLRERAQEFLNMDPDLEATLFPAAAAASDLPVRKAVAVAPKKTKTANGKRVTDDSRR